MSKSASPLPKTILPGCRRPESSSPWKVGVAPNGPVQKCVPKKLGLNSHCSPVTATVPSLATATAGSLSPSGRSNGVLEKLRLPDTVPAKADAPAKITTSKALRINPSTFLERLKPVPPPYRMRQLAQRGYTAEVEYAYQYSKPHDTVKLQYFADSTLIQH